MIRFSLRDKRLFEITEVEIRRRVDCINRQKSTVSCAEALAMIDNKRARCKISKLLHAIKVCILTFFPRPQVRLTFVQFSAPKYIMKSGQCKMLHCLLFTGSLLANHEIRHQQGRFGQHSSSRQCWLISQILVSAL